MNSTSESNKNSLNISFSETGIRWSGLALLPSQAKAKRQIASVVFVALAHPLKTSFFLFPSILLLCTFGSHRLPLLIFQLLEADLYLNPNICPIQCELCIQPNAWLCLCSFEQIEWATWLGNADIAWSLVMFVGIDQMQQGREEREKGGLCSASLPCSHGEENEIVYFPRHNYRLSPCSSKWTLSLYESNESAIDGEDCP